MLSSTSFNWEKGTWSTSGLPGEHSTDSDVGGTEASILIAGDWAPIRDFTPIIEKNPEVVYGDLLPAIRSADLAVVNLEAPLSDVGDPVCKSGAVFKGEQRHISGLTAAPFHVATLANNHVFDYGLEAFEQTLQILDQNHIQHVGAGTTEAQAKTPLKIDIKGISIGIINFSEGEDLTAAHNGPGVMGWDVKEVVETVKSLKKTVDVIIVICHCGIEYIPFPPPYVADAFNEITEAGADLVIGHHPHVPQGVVFQHNVPVCYSLGNFVFYQPTDLKYRKLGMMVKAVVNKRGLLTFELIPYEIGDNGLALLKNTRKTAFLEKLKEISLPLEDPDTLMDTWSGFLDYYGQDGFENEIAMIMGKIEKEPGKGAAMFRNRLTTLQHYHHFKDLMTRMVSDQMGTSPAWAREFAKEWLTLKR